MHTIGVFKVQLNCSKRILTHVLVVVDYFFSLLSSVFFLHLRMSFVRVCIILIFLQGLCWFVVIVCVCLRLCVRLCVYVCDGSLIFVCFVWPHTCSFANIVHIFAVVGMCFFLCNTWYLVDVVDLCVGVVPVQHCLLLACFVVSNGMAGATRLCVCVPETQTQKKNTKHTRHWRAKEKFTHTRLYVCIPETTQHVCVCIPETQTQTKNTKHTKKLEGERKIGKERYKREWVTGPGRSTNGGASLRGTGERVMHDCVAQQESKKETETGELDTHTDKKKNIHTHTHTYTSQTPHTHMTNTNTHIQ